VKSSKPAAHYRAFAAREHCRDCSMFRAPNSCTAVEGAINPLGHCDYWEHKKMSNERPTPQLSTAQKETARRLGIPEKEYASHTAELIKRGKIKREDIP
jgi:hypothetical protein